MMIEQNTNYAYKLKYKPTPARICASIAMPMRVRMWRQGTITITKITRGVKH